MSNKEKIRKVYTKCGIDVDKETIELIMTDEERTKGLIRVHKQEEIDSMNYILGKPTDNKVFTMFELDAMSRIDLFNRKIVNICKLIWDNKDNEEKLEEILKELKREGNNGDTSINNSEKVVAEKAQA